MIQIRYYLGDVLKWLKSPDSKSGRPDNRCEGSNPSVLVQSLVGLTRLFLFPFCGKYAILILFVLIVKGNT